MIVLRRLRITRQARSAVSLALFLGLACALLVSCQTGLAAEEKVEDFRYLFEIMRDNHPYLELKARAEGYDWLAHEEEFEEAVRSSRNDKEFAQAIQRMLQMINSGHTTMMSPQLYEGICNLSPEMKPWLDEAAKTDAKTVARWYGYVSNPLQYPQGQSLPFGAWYCRGDYVVYWVSEQFGSDAGVSAGDVLVTVNGKPVHEFVEDMRGLIRLRLDPPRSRLYLEDLRLPYSSRPYKLEFRQTGGKLVQASAGFEKVVASRRSPYLPTNLGQTGNVYTTMLSEGRVAYLHINQMTQYQQSEAYARVLKEFFAGIQDVPALIIDIRGNGGGDDRFWMLNVVRPLATRPLTSHGGSARRTGEFILPFVQANSEFGSTIEGLSGTGVMIDKPDIAKTLSSEQLANLPPEVLGPGFGPLGVGEMTISPSGEYPYKGKVFLLVDFTVFSSAQGFAEFCKGSGWATLVGEHTGGGNDGSTPSMVTLPNSGIPVFFAAGMGLNPDFTAVEEVHTAPDVLVERSSDDLVRLAAATAAGQVFSAPEREFDAALRECLRLALEIP